MKSYSISEFGKMFGLSRSTLLHYDRIGLLQASGRTDAGYRRYVEEDRARLERICLFRRIGLSLADIQLILDSNNEPNVALLEGRLLELSDEIARLRSQQHLIAAMLKQARSDNLPGLVDKQMWMEMLVAAGMDEAAMQRWHASFEQRAPQEHHDFLVSLGISAIEIEQIRRWSREGSDEG